MAEIIDMGHGEFLDVGEFFFHEHRPDLDSHYYASLSGTSPKFNRELLDRIKTEMVMRIYGVSPEKAQLIIASAAKAVEDDD